MKMYRMCFALMISMSTLASAADVRRQDIIESFVGEYTLKYGTEDECKQRLTIVSDEHHSFRYGFYDHLGNTNKLGTLRSGRKGYRSYEKVEAVEGKLTIYSMDFDLKLHSFVENAINGIITILNSENSTTFKIIDDSTIHYSYKLIRHGEPRKSFYHQVRKECRYERN